MKPVGKAKALIQVSLAVAILAGLAAGALNFTILKQRITRLQSDLGAQTTARATAEAELSKTRTELARTTTALDAAVREKENALATSAAEIRRAERLDQDLRAVRQERNAAQAELARYKGAGMEPEQIISVAQTLKNLRKNLTDAQGEAQSLRAKLKLTARLDTDDPLPPDLRANVVAFDPKWHFIILDAGQEQGVVEHGELLISRQGKLIAKAEIRGVQKTRCIANVKPRWELAEVMEGDLAIPAPAVR